MPSRFRRSLHFRAAHHYHVDGWTAQQDRARFGSAAEPHWHDWTLTIDVEGDLDPQTGMLLDLPQLDAMLEAQVLDRFADAHFADADPHFKSVPPSTEYLARYFYDLLAPQLAPLRLARVQISEDPDLGAEYLP